MRSAIIAAAIGIVIVAISTGPDVMAQSPDRMPPIAADKLTDAQKKAIEEFRAARSAEVSGPFIPLLRSPEVMSRARAMGDYLRFRSVLPPRLSEFVILLTARRWTQNYEWNAHEAIARQAGVSPDVITAIAEGRRPEKMSEDEDILYVLRRADADPRGQRRHLRARRRQVRRTGRRRHHRHHRLLHAPRDDAEHGADAGQGGPGAVDALKVRATKSEATKQALAFRTSYS